MFLSISKNLSVFLTFYLLSAACAKAQLSSKTSTAFYNDKISGKLAESTAGKSKSQNGTLPSQNPAIEEMANSKIKNPGTSLHKKRSRGTPVSKNKLPSGSRDLKERGHPVIKRK